MTVFSKNFQNQSGQILLVVVLVMVVSLSVGLSLATRSIINLRSSQEEESSQRAFSAAEAGVELALQTGQETLVSQDLLNSSKIENVTIQQISGTEFLLAGGAAISQDDGVDVWLSSYPDYQNPWSGELSLYWGSTSDVCSSSSNSNTMAALEVIVIAGSKTLPVTRRYAFDPCSPLRTGKNNFTAVSGADMCGSDASSLFTVATKKFCYRTPILAPNWISISSGLLMRIIPIYANTSIAVKGSSQLPSQGNRINSVGSSGNTQRKIQVFQAYPKVPSEFFQYVFFRPGNL